MLSHSLSRSKAKFPASHHQKIGACKNILESLSKQPPRAILQESCDGREKAGRSEPRMAAQGSNSSRGTSSLFTKPAHLHQVTFILLYFGIPLLVQLVLSPSMVEIAQAQVPPAPITSSGLNTQVSAPINNPGVVLSHPAMSTTPSAG